ncbi:MAG: membrane protein insertion efficiency factor YidD [Firmicutes bacterium]|nr:membrane protein insertion efficiency factor YidD [Bacillota bacterium]HQD40902.1 membrane protein insertion efficiency factor YidD [Bacillota bacterium]
MERGLGEAAVFLIRLYQKALSPLFPPSCRYSPSCSEYAKLSIEKYGFFRGTVKAVKRILRCHPWGGSGFDPP